MLNKINLTNMLNILWVNDYKTLTAYQEINGKCIFTVGAHILYPDFVFELWVAPSSPSTSSDGFCMSFMLSDPVATAQWPPLVMQAKIDTGNVIKLTYSWQLTLRYHRYGFCPTLWSYIDCLLLRCHLAVLLRISPDKKQSKKGAQKAFMVIELTHYNTPFN